MEVCSKEDGFLGSYYKARLLGKVSKDKYLVEFLTLVSEEDEKLKLREVVDAAEVRPCPPAIKVAEFNVLDKVDAYDRDGWWVGRVTGREFGEDKYSVYFESSGDEFVYSGYLLRVHQEWENGVWVTSNVRSRQRTRLIN